MEDQAEDKRRRYEELHRLAREMYAAENQRFDVLESKAGRYLSLLVVVLGVGVVGSGELAATIAGPVIFPTLAFVVFYCAFVVVGIVTLGYLIRALAVEAVQGPPLDSSFIEPFDQNTYEGAIFSFSKRWIDAAAANRIVVSKKFQLVRSAHRLLPVELGLAALSALSYVFMKAWMIAHA